LFCEASSSLLSCLKRLGKLFDPDGISVAVHATGRNNSESKSSHHSAPCQICQFPAAPCRGEWMLDIIGSRFNPVSGVFSKINQKRLKRGKSLEFWQPHRSTQ
jgi:hypothetical protein